jgi:hypothetical protein
MSDEIAKAQTAKPTEDTIFGKIARKEIKVDFLHEDDQVLFLFEIRKEINENNMTFSVLHFMIQVNKHQHIFWLFRKNQSHNCQHVHHHMNK